MSIKGARIAVPSIALRNASAGSRGTGLGGGFGGANFGHSSETIKTVSDATIAARANVNANGRRHKSTPSQPPEWW